MRSHPGAGAEHAVTPRRYRPRRAANGSRRRTTSSGRRQYRIWLGAGVACGVLLLVLLAWHTQLPPRDKAGGILLTEDFDAHSPGELWRDGEQHGQWRANYAGYGTTTVIAEDGRHELSMSPAVPKDAEATHGGLVTSLEQFDDLDVAAQLRTDRQLRPKAPNPWEVAWLVWHYTDDHHFYSIVLKPNGWELGKEDPDYPGSQRFLASGTTPSFPIGKTYNVRVRQVANEISIWVGETLLTTYRDLERPYSRGSIGLYTEDAHVYFDNVIVRRP